MRKTFDEVLKAAFMAGLYYAAQSSMTDKTYFNDAERRYQDWRTNYFLGDNNE